MRRLVTALLFAVVLSGCVGLPPGVSPVSNFDQQRYLGVWYEIARLGHRFERGLKSVTAEYSARADGGVQVRNKGYSTSKNEWKEAEGKAYFVGDTDTGHLKVSFFGPFYGSYAVFALDENYQHAFIAGYNTSYLWLLSRTPEIDKSVRDDFVAKATALGFDTDELIFVEHDSK